MRTLEFLKIFRIGKKLQIFKRIWNLKRILEIEENLMFEKSFRTLEDFRIFAIDQTVDENDKSLSKRLVAT